MGASCPVNSSHDQLITVSRVSFYAQLLTSDFRHTEISDSGIKVC